MEKNFFIQQNVGNAKYVVSFHDGTKKQKDGSPFYDINIFKNKIKLEKFIASLKKQGYVYC